MELPKAAKKSTGAGAMVGKGMKKQPVHGADSLGNVGSAGKTWVLRGGPRAKGGKLMESLMFFVIFWKLDKLDIQSAEMTRICRLLYFWILFESDLMLVLDTLEASNFRRNTCFDQKPTHPPSDCEGSKYGKCSADYQGFHPLAAPDFIYELCRGQKGLVCRAWKRNPMNAVRWQDIKSVAFWRNSLPPLVVTAGKATFFRSDEISSSDDSLPDENPMRTA